MKFNPDIHHRHSIRLAEYNYANAGAYFVTVCTHGRECLFGEVMDEIVRLNEFGEVVREEWLKSAEIREEITLDEFVVMPNHVHGIIVITNDVGATGTVAQKNNANVGVGATRWVAQDCDDVGGRATWQVGGRATQRVAPTGPVSCSVGAIIGQFKSIVTKRVNQIRDNPGVPVWQRNYFERVIRNDRELAAIREYIVNNPMKWEMDKENPANHFRPL